MSDPTAENVRRVKAANIGLRNLLKAEEQFFRQKSRVQHVKEGDHNTSFFFRHVSARNKANTIRVLLDDQGKKLETFEDISNELIKFFSCSLGQADPNVVEVPNELLKDILGVELTEEMREALIAPVLGKKIKDVLFAMNGNKAPGPDGYTEMD
ncbi:hypothetical protein V6N13_105646 [Hibiscus sabdariffa]